MKNLNPLFICSFLFFGSISNRLLAQAPVLTFTPILTTGLTNPVDVVNAGDSSNRLFIVELGGKIKIFSDGNLLPNNFLNIPTTISIGGERGLLSIAFHPHYKTNRYFFIYYTDSTGAIAVSRMQTKADNPNEADPASRKVLYTIPKPFSNHNGGRLQFGLDGKLYFGTGDGGSGGDPNNFAQNGNSLLGKMIRINVDNFDTPPYYSIPADNPYVADPNVKDEIFSMGLRNPFRWSFDKLNGDVWIGDVGQGLWEEINRQSLGAASGANYGWRCYEGKATYNTSGCADASTYKKPVFDYGHNAITGGYSVTGGAVYRGSLYPALYGWYMCADYVTANAWLLYPFTLGTYVAFLQARVPANITSFGEAENGEIYVTTLNGKLFSVSTTTSIPTLVQLFAAKPYLNFNELSWQYINSSNILLGGVEYSFDGIEFIPAGTVNNNGATSQVFSHIVNGYTTIFYRLKIATKDGQIIYSNIIKVGQGNTVAIRLYPTIVNTGQLMLESTTAVQSFCLYSSDGKKVFEKAFNNFLGNTVISLPSLNKGIYIARLFINGKVITNKIFIGN